MHKPVVEKVRLLWGRGGRQGQEKGGEENEEEKEQKGKARQG